MILTQTYDNLSYWKVLTEENYITVPYIRTFLYIPEHNDLHTYKSYIHCITLLNTYLYIKIYILYIFTQDSTYKIQKVSLSRDISVVFAQHGFFMRTMRE